MKMSRAKGFQTEVRVSAETEAGALWEKERVGCFKRTALKHVYYLG